jgi:DNA invertase Pin-like site-specific DNA recombinase
LQDDRLGMWDAVVAAKLDRLTRSLFDFVTLASWLEARGKTLVCIDPMLDLSTPAGRAFAAITATFAQFERETIAARVRDAWHKLRDTGRYAGGQVPFGYQPVKLDKGWGYEPDPRYGPIVAEMFDRYVRYASLGTITRWLNETGVPTPWNATRKRNGKPLRNSIWTTASIRKILGSRAALGATVLTDGTPVRDAQGVVVYRADALVERDVWERVQARLRANPVASKVNSWPLTGIAFCATCGASMYIAEAREEPVRIGRTFREWWESLDAAGRNELLRAAAIRAVVSRDELPAIDYQEGPLTPLDIPTMKIIDKPQLHAAIYFGNLGGMLCLRPPARLAM